MARRLGHKETITNASIVTTASSTPFKVDRAVTVSVQAAITVNTPVAATFVDGGVNTTTEVITSTAHGFPTTGLKVRLTTSGVLPGGLALATDYFVIVMSANTLKLASSLVLALAGTPIDITSAAGGGTHTITPTAIAGGSLTLEKSNNYGLDGVTAQWDAVETATAISASARAWISKVDPEFHYCRVTYALTAGQMSATTYVVVKEEN